VDIESSGASQATLVLLTLLSLGEREIEQGHFRPVESVFADIEGCDE
jgi:hypothetical protein